MQSMALPHECGFEIACNLLDEMRTGPSAVLERCTQLVTQAGGVVINAYTIGESKQQLLQRARNIAASF
jgi:hypothetical protein